jgi:hypothetical protein
MLVIRRGNGPELRIKPSARPGLLAALVSDRDFAKLTPAADEAEIRCLKWSEEIPRYAAHLAVPLLALGATVLAVLAAALPGPSAAAAQHAALRAAVTTVEPALNSLVAEPAGVTHAAATGKRLLLRAEHHLRHARVAGAGSRRARASAEAAGRLAYRTYVQLGTQAAALGHDAATIAAWQQAALTAGGSTSDTLTLVSTIAAAVMAALAALLALVQSGPRVGMIRAGDRGAAEPPATLS